MIYFDNAATGGFKPRAVTDTVNTITRYLCANPGRSGHRLSLTGAKIIENTRQILATYFGGTEERVVFTKNCTEALNLAILGSAVHGGHVITTAFEHNSVLRPLYHLQQSGVIELDVVFPQDDTPLELLIKEKIKRNTYLIVATAISNVTGYALPLKNIGQIAKENNLLYLIDGAQGAGHVELNLKELNASFIAVAGHKGLYGIMGVGALIMSDNVELSPLTFGGTGSDSFNTNQPDFYPERLEAGTLSLPAISSLLEGTKYIMENGKMFSTHLEKQTAYILEKLNKIERIKTYSLPNPAGIVAFSVSNLASSFVADILNSEFDIAVRGGYHCAPLMHKNLNTTDLGLVRVGLAVQNTTREIDFFLRSINKIAQDN